MVEHAKMQRAALVGGLAPRHWEDPVPVEHMGTRDQVRRSCRNGAAEGWALLHARQA